MGYTRYLSLTVSQSPTLIICSLLMIRFGRITVVVWLNRLQVLMIKEKGNDGSERREITYRKEEGRGKREKEEKCDGT